MESLKKLQDELQLAVINEEFEKAAMLRDEIRKMESERKSKRRNKKEEPA
jgi:protein-arginine kinase activator protein McsA